MTGELEIVRPDHARADVCLLAATHVGDAAQAPRRVQEDRRNRQVRWEAVVVFGENDFEVFLLAFAALNVEQLGVVLHHVARQRERRHVDDLHVRRRRPRETRQLRVLAECKVMHAHALGLFAGDGGQVHDDALATRELGPRLRQLLRQRRKVRRPLFLQSRHHTRSMAAGQDGFPVTLDDEGALEANHGVAEAPPAQVSAVHRLQHRRCIRLLPRTLETPPGHLHKLKHLVQVDQAFEQVIRRGLAVVDLGKQSQFVAVNIGDRHRVLGQQLLEQCNAVLYRTPRAGVLAAVRLELGCRRQCRAAADDELVQRELVQQRIVVAR